LAGRGIENGGGKRKIAYLFSEQIKKNGLGKLPF
jgi:hypothetical protein